MNTCKEINCEFYPGDGEKCKVPDQHCPLMRDVDEISLSMREEEKFFDEQDRLQRYYENRYPVTDEELW